MASPGSMLGRAVPGFSYRPSAASDDRAPRDTLILAPSRLGDRLDDEGAMAIARQTTRRLDLAQARLTARACLPAGIQVSGCADASFSALGEEGLAEYRSLLAAQPDQDGFAARYARERLAVLDGDSDAIVALLGGDLSRPHQFIAVAEAMAELGRGEEVVRRPRSPRAAARGARAPPCRARAHPHQLQLPPAP